MFLLILSEDLYVPGVSEDLLQFLWAYQLRSATLSLVIWYSVLYDRVYVFIYAAPRIDGHCQSTDSTAESLTFNWPAAKSATSYRLVGHSVSRSTSRNTTRLIGLTPGSRYTFTVWAVGVQRLHSNNITCISSTGRPIPIVINSVVTILSILFKYYWNIYEFFNRLFKIV